MAKAAKAIRLQERDRRIFDDLIECGGLLDSRTIHTRQFPFDRTGEACRRRLSLFCSHELLETYRPAITFGAAPTGRMPAVYRLTSKGAAFVHELTGVAPPFTSTGLSALTLEHRLGIAKLRLIVNDACLHEKLPPPQWIGEYDPRPGPRPPVNAKLSKRFRLCHQYEINGAEVTCWPDAASLISVPGNDGTAFHRLLVLWEYDRSTERTGQVQGKMPGYQLLLARQDDRRLFENADAAVSRVFVVTQSVERRKNLADAIRAQTASPAVRLATLADLSPKHLFRSRIWFTAAGEAKSIITSA